MAPAGSSDAALPEDASLARLVATLRAADRLTAEAVRLAGQLDGVAVGREEGMTVDAALRLHAGTTRGDVDTVLTAADLLRGMPVAAGLFARGVLTWGHVRALASGARSFDAATRRALDTHLGEHVDRLERMDGERLLWAIDDAVAQHTPAAKLEDRAERDADARSLIITPRLDGTGTIFSDLDVEGFATVTGRLDREADVPLAAASPGDDGTGLPRSVRDAHPGSRSRLLADALVRVCASRDRGASGGAPVRFTVVVDADTVTDGLAGTLRPAVAARPPRIVRRALDRLSCDAALDVVVRRGHDLLAAQRYAPDVTSATRRAVFARDGGCRFPGCRAPVAWCDVHHVVERSREGHHGQTNLVALCRRHHVIVHRRGWKQRFEPDGTYRVTRNGRTWTTRSRHADDLPPPRASAPRGGPPTAGPRDSDPPGSDPRDSDPPGSDPPGSDPPTPTGSERHPADGTAVAGPPTIPF